MKKKNSQVRRFTRSKAGTFFYFIFIFLVGAFSVLPLIYCVCTSFKPLDELLVFPPRFFVHNPTWQNYKILPDLLSNLKVPITRYFFNSLYVAVVGTIANVFISSMMAFVLSKSNLKYKNQIFIIIQFSLMFSGYTLAMPRYLMGIHVLCEKPVALEARDVEKLYEAAERNKVKFMAAQVIRFWPEYELLKNLYDTKKYGKLLSATMKRVQTCPGWSFDGWMKDEKRSGLVPFDLHIHDLDFLVYAFGKPEKVTNFRSKRPEQDYMNAIYEFDGFFVSAEASWFAASYPFAMGFRFQFEHAIVEFENGKLIIFEEGGKKVDLSGTAEGETGEISLPQSDAYANEIRYFADCVLNDAWPEKVKQEELEAVIDILNAAR